MSKRHKPSERVKEIKKMVNVGEYFTINRARQYGKTTTLNALRNLLPSEYSVINIDFQGLGDASFRTEESFCRSLIKLILEENEYGLINTLQIYKMDSFVLSLLII